MPLYAASLWDSFTTRRFKMPFKTVVGLGWNCAEMNRALNSIYAPVPSLDAP